MHAPLATALEMPAPSEYGPAMASLRTDRQRRFVVAMFDVPQNRRARINAARLAGYGTATSSNKSIAVIAARLADDEAIQLAIEEEGRRRFRTLAPVAHNALKKLLQNPKHRDHGKAVELHRACAAAGNAAPALAPA
jgi:phage terminase small subunit